MRLVRRLFAITHCMGEHCVLRQLFLNVPARLCISPLSRQYKISHVDIAVTNATIPHPLELDPDKVCTARVCVGGANGSIHIESISNSSWRAHLKAHAMSTVNNVVRHGRAYGTMISRECSRPVCEHRFQCAATEPCPLSSNACAVVSMGLSDNLNWYFGSLGTDSLSRALDAAIHLAEGTTQCSIPSPASTAKGTLEPCVRVPVAAGALFCRFTNTAIGMQLTANFSKQSDLGSRAVNTHRLSDRIVLTSLEIRSVRGSSIFVSAQTQQHCHRIVISLLCLRIYCSGKLFLLILTYQCKPRIILGVHSNTLEILLRHQQGYNALCRQVMSMIELHVTSGILVCDTSLTETFVRTFGAHDPTPRMRNSAPINSRHDLHASAASIWGVARAFAHESAASSQTTVKVYALDNDIHCVDVNTQKINTLNDTWTRATRVEGVTHNAILIPANEQHCILDGGQNSRSPIIPPSTFIKDQRTSARHLKLCSPLSQVSSHGHATKLSMGFGIVFGGLGAVGGHAAAWLLASRNNRCIALSSRSGQSAVRPTIINLENAIIIAT